MYYLKFQKSVNDVARTFTNSNVLPMSIAKANVTLTLKGLSIVKGWNKPQ